MKDNITGIMNTRDEGSFCIHFHKNSLVSEVIFSSNPTHEDKPVSVIQVMLIGDGDLLVQLQFKK